jgi:hypothetical protein
MLHLLTRTDMFRRPGRSVRRGFNDGDQVPERWLGVHPLRLGSTGAGTSFDVACPNCHGCSTRLAAAGDRLEDAGDRPGRQPAGRVAAFRRVSKSIRDQAAAAGFQFNAQSVLRPNWIEGFVPIWAQVAGRGPRHRPCPRGGQTGEVRRIGPEQAVSVEKADLAQPVASTVPASRWGCLQQLRLFGASGSTPTPPMTSPAATCPPTGSRCCRTT